MLITYYQMKIYKPSIFLLVQICIIYYNGSTTFISLDVIKYEFEVTLIRMVCICCLLHQDNMKTFAGIHYFAITKSVNFSNVCSKKNHVTGNELHCLNEEL